MKNTAFFDLDKTILKNNSGKVLLQSAYKNGLLSRWKLIQAFCMALLHKLNLIDPSAIIDKFGSWLAKLPVKELETLCNQIIEKDLIPAIRPQIIDKIKMHKEQGANLVILSSSLTSICNPLAKHLEMHSVICSELEVVNQQYTGRPIGKFCFKDEKLKRMNQYLIDNNYAFENSYYYADSIDDLPVLQSVGYPVCVNPDRRLEKIARAQNWVIHKWG
jgi:HAD superfamily hydrolase (TIGR01490 family)